MTNLHERMLLDWRIEPATSWICRMSIQPSYWAVLSIYSWNMKIYSQDISIFHRSWQCNIWSMNFHVVLQSHSISLHQSVIRHARNVFFLNVFMTDHMLWNYLCASFDFLVTFLQSLITLKTLVNPSMLCMTLSSASRWLMMAVDSNSWRFSTDIFSISI